MNRGGVDLPLPVYLADSTARGVKREGRAGGRKKNEKGKRTKGVFTRQKSPQRDGRVVHWRNLRDLLRHFSATSTCRAVARSLDKTATPLFAYCT